MASTDSAHSDASLAALIPLGSHAKSAPIEIKRPVTLIGSRKDAVRLHLESSTVSKAHCVIVLNSWGCYVHDLASRTGTLVNGKPVIDADLADGDVLQVGRFQFKYRAPQRTRPKPMPLPPADIAVSGLPAPLSANKRVIVIGRRAGSDIELTTDSRVSNIHAIVVEQDGRRLVRDLGSRTGTWLDEKPIHQDPLPDFEALRVGGASITFKPRGTLADAVNPAGAIPVPLDEAGPGVIGLDPLDLDLDLADSVAPASPAETAVPAGDDLGDLRRGWKAPARPAEPTINRPVVAPPLELEPLQLEPEPAAKAPTPAEPPADVAARADTPISDDDLDLLLAPVRAEAPAPVRPAEPPHIPAEIAEAAPAVAEPDLDVLAEPAAEAEAPVDDAELDLAPEPTAADVLPVAERPDLHTPPAGPAPVAETSPAIEVPAEADEDDLDLLDLAPPAALKPSGEPALDVLAEPDAEAEAPVADAELALAPEPAAAAVLPEIDRPDLHTPVVADEAAAAGEAPAAEVELPAEADLLALDDAEPTPIKLDVTPAAAETPVAAPGPVDDAAAEQATDALLELDGAAATAPAIAAEPAAESESDELADLVPAGLALTPEAEDEADADALDFAAVVPPIENDAAETPTEIADLTPAGLALTPEADEADELDLEPLDLGDLTLDRDADVAGIHAEADVVKPDPDAPTVAADDELDLEPVDLDALKVEPAVPTADAVATVDSLAPEAEDDLALEPLDLSDLELEPDADAAGIRAEVATPDPDAPAAGPDAAVRPAPIGPDTPTAAPADVVLPPVAEAPAETDLEPLDLDDLLAELDADAPKTGAAADADIDALLADPDAPAPNSAEKHGNTNGQSVSDTTVALTDTFAGLDVIDLDDDAEDDARPAAGGPAVTPLPPNLAAAATIIEPPTPLGDTVGVVDDSLAGTAFVEPAEVAPEPDLVRLNEEADDDNEATALAVDLGLVFDDDADLGGPPPAPVAGPAAPVEIDLASAASTDTAAAGDVVDADDIEVVDPTRAARPAAEVHKPAGDDHIDAPQGGSLADLMIGGPPLVGGSFMSMPPVLPSLPPQPRDKRRPGRIGFGGEVSRPTSAPFAAERTIGNALGETEDDDFAGLADVKTPSIDAFSGRPATPPAPAGDATAAEPEEAELAVPADRFRPRGTIAPVLPAPARPAEPGVAVGVTVMPSRPAAVSADAELKRARRHKNRVRRVIACLVGMIVLIGGAAWGVYYFTPLTSKIDARISYDGLDRLGIEEQTNFRVQQNNLLVSETTRSNAIAALPAGIKEPGFLASGKTIYDTISMDPKIRWPAEQPTVMRLQIRSLDKQDDVARLRALAEEVVKASDADVKKKGELSNQLREQTSLVSQLNSQIRSLGDQLQALKQASLAKSDVKNASELNAEYLAAEPAVTTIKGRRQELEATVDRLGKPTAAQPTNAVGDAAAADQELAALDQQLDRLQQASRRPATEAGSSAQKELDSLISGFETDLGKAQQLGNNPQLSAYIEAAKSSFKQMRELTAGLIRRQENNLTRVAELKSTLSDKMQARIQQRLANDTELKKLRDNQAILERQFNAAKAQQLNQEAQKVELDMRVLKVKIAEREDNFKNDAVDSETIAGLQKIIDSTESEIRADRKNIDERLTAVQSDFLKNTPAVEKLPDDQKALAVNIKKKLGAMNDARRAYNEATEKAQAAQAKAEADNKEQVAALQAKRAARRQDILAAAQAKQAENDEATRKTRLAAAQTELADVRLQEQNAQHRLADAVAAIEANEKQRRVNAQADADRQAKIAQQDELSSQLRAASTRRDTLGAEYAKLIVPDRQMEVISYDDSDRRPVLLAAIVGGIVALLLIPILLDLLALYRETHPAAHAEPVHAADEGFEPLIAEEVPARKALPEPASV